jgi:hypothetical protein
VKASAELGQRLFVAWIIHPGLHLAVDVLEKFLRFLQEDVDELLVASGNMPTL